MPATLPDWVWSRPDWPDWFWQRVDRSGGADACWPYVGSTGRSRSGNLWIGGQKWEAARVAFELAYDPPSGTPYHHTCSNATSGPCCNWAHLARGVGRRGAPKLTEAQVEVIRSSADRATILARRYGVTRQTIHRVRSGPKPRRAEKTDVR